MCVVCDWEQRQPTFILANVFESKGQAGVLSLHYPHLAKGTLSNDS